MDAERERCRMLRWAQVCAHSGCGTQRDGGSWHEHAREKIMLGSRTHDSCTAVMSDGLPIVMCETRCPGHRIGNAGGPGLGASFSMSRDGMARRKGEEERSPGDLVRPPPEREYEEERQRSAANGWPQKKNSRSALGTEKGK